MSDLNKETIRNLTKLCRIKCTEEEQERLLNDLKNILNYIELLDEIDTTHVPPCNHVMKDMANVMREDEIGHVLTRQEFLSNAPSQVGGMIKVPPVIKQS